MGKAKRKENIKIPIHNVEMIKVSSIQEKQKVLKKAEKGRKKDRYSRYTLAD